MIGQPGPKKFSSLFVCAPRTHRFLFVLHPHDTPSTPESAYLQVIPQSNCEQGSSGSPPVSTRSTPSQSPWLISCLFVEPPSTHRCLAELQPHPGRAAQLAPQTADLHWFASRASPLLSSSAQHRTDATVRGSTGQAGWLSGSSLCAQLVTQLSAAQQKLLLLSSPHPDPVATSLSSSSAEQSRAPTSLHSESASANVTAAGHLPRGLWSPSTSSWLPNSGSGIFEAPQIFMGGKKRKVKFNLTVQ